MKRISIQSIIVIIALTSFAQIPFAQGQGRPPGGRGPGGFDPNEMVKREKQNLYKKVEDLSEDQKMLLDGIYDEFAVSIGELREEMRQTQDRQSMRPKMMALRDEKDELIKDVLNEQQFGIYEAMMENNRKQMRERMQQRGNRPPVEEGETSEEN